MKAVDTNILARLILQDDEEQAATAAAVLGDPVWIAARVWVELGWVLGKRLRIDRNIVCDAMQTLLAMETVHVADREGIAWAIERHRAGVDWADALHLVMAPSVADTFVTFDRDIARRAPDAPVAIETLA